jgi:hypothetical protein
MIHSYTIEFLCDLVYNKGLVAKNCLTNYGFNKNQLIKKLTHHGYNIEEQLIINGKAAKSKYYSRNSPT